MKQVNNFVLFGFLMCFISVFSQDVDTPTDDNPLSKGTFFLSGQSDFRAGINNIGDSSLNTSVYSVSPTIGYFLINHLVVGAGVNFSGFKSESMSSGEFPSESLARSRNVSFTPFARYYFDTGKMKPYVSTSVGFGSGRNKTESTTLINDVVTSFENESKSRSTVYSVTGGAAYFLTKDVSLDIGVRYINSTFKSESDNGGNSPKNTSSNINLVGGFSIYL
ncbi:outer membrane beta-barrel protein [Dokdonia ponticola]|uniref:Outer membrane beta-barrel protein n=1 Tax=Dokdonia ponticola TaxID=2041041 RepID=A0ABV9HUP9_9FLAO